MEMEIRLPGGARVEATFDGYTVLTDQPPYAGGDGSAPSPFALFFASIGTCVGYYVLSFCRQRDIPTDQISVHLQTETDPATRMISRVKMDIHLPPDFPQQYLRAVVNAAEACAVKKHIEKPPVFEVQAVVGQ